MARSPIAERRQGRRLRVRGPGRHRVPAAAGAPPRAQQGAQRSARDAWVGDAVGEGRRGAPRGGPRAPLAPHLALTAPLAPVRSAGDPAGAGRGVVLEQRPAHRPLPRRTSWPPRGDGELEVVVVDNGSTDGSVDAGTARHPGVRLVQTGANLGFAGGVNAGLADLGDLDAVALVNSDAFVEPGWLAPLVTALEADDARGRGLPEDPVRRPGGGRPGRDQQRRQRARPDLGAPRPRLRRGRRRASTTARRTSGAGAGRPCSSGGATSTRSVTSTSGSSCTRGRRPRVAGRSSGLALPVRAHLGRPPPAPSQLRWRAHAAARRPEPPQPARRRQPPRRAARGGSAPGRGRSVGSWSRVGTDVLRPLAPRRRPDLAPLRRRVRAAVDAARLLAGGNPPPPVESSCHAMPWS